VGELRADAQVVHALLAQEGASFVDELAARSGWPLPRLAGALAECVARGLVAADGFAGLRALSAGPRQWSLAALSSGGRWYAVRPSALPAVADEDPLGPAAAAARRLLARWGVLFPRLLAREALAPPWRELVAALRRMEARGEVRGGRFVHGFSGEQYALPEALACLRECARAPQPLPALDPRDPLVLTGLLPSIAQAGEATPTTPAGRPATGFTASTDSGRAARDSDATAGGLATNLAAASARTGRAAGARPGGHGVGRIPYHAGPRRPTAASREPKETSPP
jgi:ATP-dependent helicase Lhr and Lhr-like helicase